MNKSTVFLSVEDVLFVHNDQIFNYGGEASIRQLPLLESAVSQPEQSFGDKYLHEDIYEMAAAYLYHICQNHPFADGNKRSALSAALVFLELNNISIVDPEGKLYQLTIDTATGVTDKKKIAMELKGLI